jgi:hypothetical protein
MKKLEVVNRKSHSTENCHPTQSMLTALWLEKTKTGMRLPLALICKCLPCGNGIKDKNGYVVASGVLQRSVHAFRGNHVKREIVEDVSS